MRIRLDNILLCVLWLLAVTLGTCFWFNTVFGFDIFSASHWQYVASLQAAQNPIKPGFYVSMAVAIFITIFGLYLVVRPRKRRIRLPIVRVSKQNSDSTSATNNNTQNVPVTPAPIANNDASTLDIMGAEVQPAPQTPTQPTPPPTARPPRLVLPTLNGNFMSAHQTTTPARNIAQQQSESDATALREIFSGAGYTVKPNTRVNGIQTALIAIGTNETMWLGCVGVKTTDVRAIIEKFQQVFADTLDETYISVNGFAVAAPDAATSEFQDILMFNKIDEVREYMRANPNPPTPADDDGMFDAYSQYIDAVITHIGKI